MIVIIWVIEGFRIESTDLVLEFDFLIIISEKLFSDLKMFLVFLKDFFVENSKNTYTCMWGRESKF